MAAELRLLSAVKKMPVCLAFDSEDPGLEPKRKTHETKYKYTLFFNEAFLMENL